MVSKNDLSQLLFYPFDQDALEALPCHIAILMMGSVPTAHISNFDNIDVYQPFKPDADLWQTQEYKVLQSLERCTKKYDAVFCLVPQQKQAAYYLIAQALDVLNEDGLLICVAANDAGGKQIEQKIKSFGLTATSLSKSKSRIVWTKKHMANVESIAQHIQTGQQQTIEIADYEFITQPGIYGWNKIDKGSQLLIDNVPDDLTGMGADFGCGYGFLSDKILQHNPQIKKIYSIDADYNALNCAKENLKQYTNVEYQWCDLTAQTPAYNLDWVVMNPPFHEGKKADSNIGQQFIETAHEALSKKGMLYMVANINLPYEKTLERLFSNVDTIIEKNGYKILFAQK